MNDWVLVIGMVLALVSAILLQRVARDSVGWQRWAFGACAVVFLLGAIALFVMALSGAIPLTTGP